MLGSRLAEAERQLRALQAEVHADLGLTRFDEPVPELDELVDGLVGLLRAAAGQLGVAPGQRSARRWAGAVLSLLWSDLVEIEPGRLVRAWAPTTFRTTGRSCTPGCSGPSGRHKRRSTAERYGGGRERPAQRTISTEQGAWRLTFSAVVPRNSPTRRTGRCGRARSGRPGAAGRADDLLGRMAQPHLRLHQDAGTGLELRPFRQQPCTFQLPVDALFLDLAHCRRTAWQMRPNCQRGQRAFMPALPRW